MDDFLKRLFELLKSGDFDFEFGDTDGYGVDMKGLGFGMNGFDNLPRFNGKNVRRMITISVAEDDKEGIERAIRTLQQLLKEKELEKDEEEEDETTFGDNFIEEWE